jgi:purine-nucleoside phosphorylase
VTTHGSHDQVAAATARVRDALGDRRPDIAIVLGSGLGKLSSRLDDAVRVPYAELPGFHQPAVPGHSGELVAGTLGGVPVLLQSGRFHMYEGHSASEAAHPVRVFAALGISRLIVTNAAGGINRDFAPGTVMLINDHINLTGRNPLDGPVRPGETRFPDLSAAYDPELRSIARRIANDRGIHLAEGVYAGLLGPNYETPAEIRMLATMGADAVGMSTVMEVISARANGIRCLGFSLVTNPAAGISPTPLNHEEVTAMANAAGDRLGDLVEGVVREIAG